MVMLIVCWLVDKKIQAMSSHIKSNKFYSAVISIVLLVFLISPTSAQRSSLNNLLQCPELYKYGNSNGQKITPSVLVGSSWERFKRGYGGEPSLMVKLVIILIASFLVVTIAIFLGMVMDFLNKYSGFFILMVLILGFWLLFEKLDYMFYIQRMNPR